VNNHGAFSSDHIGANDEYPDADHATRERIFRDHAAYVRGLWYFLQNDERLPASVRERAGRWGLCRDEFTDTGHWPHQLYVREARRMIGETVMTSATAAGRSARTTPWASPPTAWTRTTCSGTSRAGRPERGRRPGGRARPLPVSYRAIVPRRGEATNLLVPVALSASHIAYGSIRMEPVFMILASRPPPPPRSPSTATASSRTCRTTGSAAPPRRRPNPRIPAVDSRR